MSRIDNIEEVNKSIDEIVHVEKFNPYHDSLGRFTTSEGVGSVGATSGGGTAGASYTDKVNPKWGRYDQTVGRSQLANYGRIYLDQYNKPIDDIYETDRIHRKQQKNEKTKNTDTKAKDTKAKDTKPKKTAPQTDKVNPKWGRYDQSVGRSQLANYGRIYLDQYNKPIDDINMTDRIHRRQTKS